MFGNSSKKDKVVVLQVEKDKLMARHDKVNQRNRKVWAETLKSYSITEETFDQTPDYIPTVLHLMRSNYHKAFRNYEAIAQDPTKIVQFYGKGDDKGPKVTAYDGYENFVRGYADEYAAKPKRNFLGITF